MLRACYPGSFDPLTLGHLDLIERGCAFCNELIVAVIDNPNKKTLFSLAERQQMLSESLQHLPQVRIASFSGLLVEFLRQQKATLVVRGLRDSADASGEIQMARLNRQMGDCDTVWLAAEGRHAHISSSFVREIARLGGPIDHLVTPLVAQRMEGKLAP